MGKQRTDTDYSCTAFVADCSGRWASSRAETPRFINASHRSALNLKQPRARGQPGDLGKKLKLNHWLSSEDFGQQSRTGVKIHRERPELHIRRTFLLFE